MINFEFKINGKAKLEIEAKDNRDETLLNMVFPDGGEYVVEKHENKILIYKKEKND